MTHQQGRTIASIIGVVAMLGGIAHVAAARGGGCAGVGTTKRVGGRPVASQMNCVPLDCAGGRCQDTFVRFTGFIDPRTGFPLVEMTCACSTGPASPDCDVVRLRDLVFLPHFGFVLGQPKEVGCSGDCPEPETTSCQEVSQSEEPTGRRGVTVQTFVCECREPKD